MKKVLIGIILFYQRQISPALPPTCRYRPTCSSYAKEAIETYGAVKGSYLAIKRILRCHPFAKGGFDPVPLPKKDCAPNNSLPSEILSEAKPR